MAPGKPQSHNGQGCVGYRKSAQGAPDSVRREWCVGSSILAAQACISRFRRLPLPSQKQGANTASAKTLVPRRERRSAFAPGSWALAEQPILAQLWPWLSPWPCPSAQLLQGSEAQQSVTDVVASVLWPLPACAANLSSARRGLEAAQNRWSGAYSVSQ